MSPSMADDPSDVTPNHPDLRSTGYRTDPCDRCRSPRSFHVDAGPCRALGCRCPGWVEPEDSPASSPMLVRRPTRRSRPSTPSATVVRGPGEGSPLTPDPHLREPHNPLRFGPDCYGAEGCCSFYRFCGYQAVWDSYDGFGRRRALCRRHFQRSRVFGAGS
jgi:hypothetical protein